MLSVDRNEHQAVGDYAEVDRLDTTTEGPHVTMRTVDSLVLALPQPPGLLFQSVRMEEFDFCSTCGEFFLYLWACQYCGEPMCRHPQCLSPLDSNVCTNHVICQICLSRPSFSQCLACRQHYCPECAAFDTLFSREDELYQECEVEDGPWGDDPWDERYDEDGNYIFGMAGAEDYDVAGP